VPITQKLQVHLESLLARAYPDRRIETSAFGRSGAGTAVELAYYEAYGRDLQPDLVVLVFADNDFADNSALLAGIGYGWHPDHPPWPLFEEDPGTGGFRSVAPDRDSARHRLDGERPPDAAAWLKEHLGWSRLVQRLALTLMPSGERQERLETLRIERLSREERFGRKLAGWRYPDDLDHNQMFFAREMPPAFDEALRITDHILGRFAEEAERHGFAMLIAAVPGCSAPPGGNPQQRELIDRGQLARLEQVAAPHGIPVLDLGTAFAAKGDPHTAHWRHDTHWNPTGHRWAAEAIAEFYLALQRARM
jgi:hypothetical protein